MWTYSWIDISPDPGIGVVLGMIVCLVVAAAGVAWLVGRWWFSRSWEAADHQSDLRDQMEVMRRLGVSPGVRYALAMKEGFRPETAAEQAWVEVMQESLARIRRRAVPWRLGERLRRPVSR